MTIEIGSYDRSDVTTVIRAYVAPPEALERLRDDLPEVSRDVFRALRRCMYHGDVGDAFDELYLDLGGEG